MSDITTRPELWTPASIKADHKLHKTGCQPATRSDDVPCQPYRIATALARAYEREQKVRALHQERFTRWPPPGGYVCEACGVPVESEPCETIRALDGEA